MKSINFHVKARDRNPNITIHIHPLLLSLCETFNASDINPDIGSISENDKRVLKSSFYTSPSALPLLEIHFSGKNGMSLLSNRNGYVLISVVNCRECMTSALQDYSGGSNATQLNLAATFHALEDNLVRNRCRTSLGGVQGNFPSTCGSNVAGMTGRAKGKQTQKAGSWDADPSSLEKQPEKSPQESRDREAEPCMFARVPVKYFANDICCSLNA
jgi:hypothetical protein